MREHDPSMRHLVTSSFRSESTGAQLASKFSGKNKESAVKIRRMILASTLFFAGEEQMADHELRFLIFRFTIPRMF
jgi:hypothetical protein